MDKLKLVRILSAAVILASASMMILTATYHPATETQQLIYGFAILFAGVLLIAGLASSIYARKTLE